MGTTWPTRPLTARELQVLAGAANGQQNAAIGLELGINEDTVKTHMRRVFAVLGARDRAHAVAIALATGLMQVGVVQVPGTRTRSEREQQLLALLLACLGQDVCLRLVGGRLVPCEVAAIMPDSAVGVFAAPMREQRRYRLCEIDTIMRQEIINA